MREYEKQKEEFRKWLLDTYPGDRGKNRRESFMKHLTTIEDIAGADLELEMTRVPTDKFGDTVMELDKANAMAGWYRSTLNCWKYFQEEKTGMFVADASSNTHGRHQGSGHAEARCSAAG